MRYFLPALGLSALLLSGCGNDNNTNSTFFSQNPSGFLQASPIDAGLPLNVSNGLQSTITMLNAVHVDGGGPEVAGAAFADFEANHPLEVAEAIQASYGALLARGSTTVSGPSGGSYTTTVNGTAINLILNGFNTPTGSVDGSVNFAGATNAAGFTSNSTFNSLRVSPAGGRVYSLVGPGTYSSTRSSATGLFSTVFGSNATVSDLGSGGTARFINMVTTSTTNQTAAATIAQAGRILFSGYGATPSLTGAVDLTTPVRLVQEGEVAFAGQWLFVGTGSTRATVLENDAAEIAAANPGGLFTPLQTVNLSTVLQTP